MLSPFAAALHLADADIDGHMAEMVSVVPMRIGDYGKTPDPDRPAFDVGGLAVEIDGSSTNITGLASRVAYEEISVEIRRTVLAGRKVRKGDEVILLDRDGAPRLEVNRMERLDPERILLVLGPVAEG